MANEELASFLVPVKPARRRQAQECRLEAELIDSGRAINEFETRGEALGPDGPAVLARCRALHTRACEASSRYVAYDCIQQARCELVALMTPGERSAAYHMLAAEADRKLRNWRQAAAQSMATLVEKEPVAALQMLMRNIHAAQQNKQHAIEMLHTQRSLTVVLLLGAVVSFGISLAWLDVGWFGNSHGDPPLWQIIVTGVQLGLLGGVLSLAYSVIGGDVVASVPEARLRWEVTAARPFIGAAVAIPIVLFVQSGVLNLGKGNVGVTLAFCFFGGFSERWFLSQVDRISEPESRPKAPPQGSGPSGS